jgi:hypothetical protein
MSVFTDITGGGGDTAPATPAPPSSTASAPTASDSASWLSGLGSLFAGIGSGVAGVVKAEQPVARPYTPYYTATGINPSVAQPLAVGSLFNSPIFLLLLAVGAYFLIKKRE